MVEKEDRIEIFNADGSLKSKEDFMATVESLYDDAAASLKGNSLGIPDTYFGILTDPECQIDVESTLETFDFTERTIYLTEEIKPEMAVSIFEIIRFWNKVDKEDEIPIEEREPIKIYINTPGGDLDGVLSIIPVSFWFPPYSFSITSSITPSFLASSWSKNQSSFLCSSYKSLVIFVQLRTCALSLVS